MIQKEFLKSGQYLIKDKIYFISSEKQSSPPCSPYRKYNRLYTVRLCLPNGEIKTISEFQGCKTMKEARDLIKGILEDFEK